MTMTQLKRAALARLAVPPERRVEVDGVMERLLQAFRERDAVEGVAPYRFNLGNVLWLERGVRREMKL
jgi:hypothetical protein